MGEAEKKIEQHLVKKVVAVGGIPYKFMSPGRRSVPDRICVFPTGIILFVECKSPVGVLTVGQERELERLTKLGASVAVVHTKEEVNTLIEAVMEATNERL